MIQDKLYINYKNIIKMTDSRPVERSYIMRDFVSTSVAKQFTFLPRSNCCLSRKACPQLCRNSATGQPMQPVAYFPPSSFIQHYAKHLSMCCFSTLQEPSLFHYILTISDFQPWQLKLPSFQTSFNFLQKFIFPFCCYGIMSRNTKVLKLA